MNVEPRPGFDSTVRLPPCASAMPRLTESPRPVPPLSRFVVKNGSKIRDCSSSGMPAPVSETVASTPSASQRTSIFTEPPPCIAWRAFASRLRKICLIWFGLTLTSAASES